MFCNNCGNEVAEGTVFCQNCGSSVAPEGGAQPENPVDKAKGFLQQNSGIVKIAGAVVAVILLICLFGGGGYKKAVNKYFKACKAANAKQLVNLTLPKDIQKEYFDEVYDETKKEFLEDYKDDLKDAKEDFKDEDGKIKWEIKKAEKLGKLDKLEEDVEGMIGGDDLDDFRDLMENVYGDYGLKEKRISKAYAVKVKVTVEYDGDKEKYDDYAIVYKYKGDWYVYGLGNPIY